MVAEFLQSDRGGRSSILFKGRRKNRKYWPCINLSRLFSKQREKEKTCKSLKNPYFREKVADTSETRYVGRNVNHASSSRHDHDRELSTRKLKENISPFYQIRYPSRKFKVIRHEP